MYINNKSGAKISDEKHNKLNANMKSKYSKMPATATTETAQKPAAAKPATSVAKPEAGK